MSLRRRGASSARAATLAFVLAALLWGSSLPPVFAGHASGRPDTWADVSVGSLHTCAVRPTGTLWCWGWNLYGQLGQGDHRNRNVPTQVGIDSDWAAVELGEWHTCGLRTDHSLWCWGYNVLGVLGVGDQRTRLL